TLLLEGGRPFRVTKRNPCALDFHSFLYRLRTTASGSGSVIGAALFHASQSGALFVALQPEKREHFRGTEPTTCQPKAAPGPLYIPGAKTRIPAAPVTCDRICGST